MPIASVIFDLYETLVGFRPEPIEKGLEEVAGVAGVSSEALGRAERTTLRDRMRGCFGGTVEDEYAEILREAGADPRLAPMYVATALEAWQDAAFLFPDVLDCLRELGDAGVRLGMISNCSRLTRPLFDHHWPLRRHFEPDCVILSCEVRTIKPERAIFDLSLERVGGQPGAAMLIDDTRDYVDAARDLGWDARRIVRGSTAGSNEAGVIDDLRELMADVPVVGALAGKLGAG